MIQGFERIIIEVPDVAAATEEYAQLLGSFQTDGDSSAMPLDNVAIELSKSDQPGPARIAGLAFLDDSLAPGESVKIADPPRGLNLHRVAQRTSQRTAMDSGAGISAVDHVVLMTKDADDCIARFGEKGLGLRLALDQLVPEWGGRMLFFRAGQLTLEVIHNTEKPPEYDFLWGITYLCADIDATAQKLEKAGVSLSEIRVGRKPGTRVASIKSHNLGLPTLLIEPVV
jgi:catechol 2,3-dioxygenase-like lactoylglutathione lyase family enzyme